MNAVRQYFQDHGTKLLGLMQVTVGALAIADQTMVAGVFGQNGLRWIILSSGVLTAWRGFYNSNRLNP